MESYTGLINLATVAVSNGIVLTLVITGQQRLQNRAYCAYSCCWYFSQRLRLKSSNGPDVSN